MTPGTEVEANGLRYLVVAVDAVSVTYRVWIGDGWSDTRTIVRGAWEAMVGPKHAAPGWCSADGET